MKKIIILLLLSLSANAFAGDLPSFPFMHITGQATLKVPPEVATLNFNVTSVEKTFEKSVQSAEEKSTQIIEFLKKNKVEDRDIVSAYLFTERENNYNTKTLVGYKSVRSFKVFVRNIKDFSKFIDGLTSLNKALRISVSFSVTYPKEAERRALEMAIKDAKKRAEHMAKIYGLEIVKVAGISEMPLGGLSGVYVGSDSHPLRYASMETDGGRGRSSSSYFVPKEIEVSKRIHALYEMK